MPVWKEVAAAAHKTLGPTGKLPSPSVDPSTIEATLTKTKAAFNASRIDLEKKLLDYVNALTQAKNNFKQYADIVKGSKFGLDPDDPEDKKHIDATVKLLLEWMKTVVISIDKHAEPLASLDRAVTGASALDGMKM